MSAAWFNSPCPSPGVPALASVVFARLLAWALAALGSLPLLWLLPLSLPRISLCIRPRALIFETCSPARLHGHSLLRGASHEGCIPLPFIWLCFPPSPWAATSVVFNRRTCWSLFLPRFCSLYRLAAWLVSVSSVCLSMSSHKRLIFSPPHMCVWSFFLPRLCSLPRQYLASNIEFARAHGRTITLLSAACVLLLLPVHRRECPRLRAFWLVSVLALSRFVVAKNIVFVRTHDKHTPTTTVSAAVVGRFSPFISVNARARERQIRGPRAWWLVALADAILCGRSIIAIKYFKKNI